MKLGKVPNKQNEFKTSSPADANTYQQLQQQVREAYRLAKEKKLAKKMSEVF